jgi:hypothetical protein
MKIERKLSEHQGRSDQCGTEYRATADTEIYTICELLKAIYEREHLEHHDMISLHINERHGGYGFQQCIDIQTGPDHHITMEINNGADLSFYEDHKNDVVCLYGTANDYWGNMVYRAFYPIKSRGEL